jgi:uncharacterized integral membrane protein
MRYMRHLGKLLRELFGFARHHKAWWMIPIALMLLLMALVIVIGQSAAPLIYPFF